MIESLCFILWQFYLLKLFHYKYFRYYTLTNSVTLPLMYFRFNYVTVFACIFVTIIVSVNGMDVFPLTDISVTVIVNGKNTEHNDVRSTNFGDFCTSLVDSSSLK